MTHYEVLQISPNASREVIDAAWKTLMLIHHPDKGGKPERAREINQAHDVLADPKKRRQYDLSLGVHQMPGPKRRGNPVNPGRAYPDPYPGMPGPFSGDLPEAMREVAAGLMAEIQEAVDRANVAALERIAGQNPLLRAVIDQFLRAEKRRRA